MPPSWTEIDRLEELKVQLEFNPAAAQNDELLKDGKVSVDNIQTGSNEQAHHYYGQDMSGWHRHAVTAAVAKGRTAKARLIPLACGHHFSPSSAPITPSRIGGLACMAFVSANRQGDFWDRFRGFVSGLKIPFPRERRQRSQRTRFECSYCGRRPHRGEQSGPQV